MFDLDAYLQRIGLGEAGPDGPPTIAQMHRAHATSIPFENLDPHRGIPVSLAIEDIQRKLVAEGRGGYCFEHNLLLAAALREMGAEVETYLARVRRGANGAVRPRGHLILRVSLDDQDWHADVGLGLGTLLEPLPWGAGEEHEQSGWRFRIVPEGHELVLQTLDREEWADVYGFQPLPAPPVDLETSNWFVSTNPGSPFASGLIAANQDDAGVRTSLCDWSGTLVLAEQRPDGTQSSEEVPRERIPGLLAERFGLDGFALDERGRVVLAAE